jgi:hypothetical protein
MLFYDMIKIDDESATEIPCEIGEMIKNFQFVQIENNKICFLDYIWNICKSLCRKYTETEWIKSLGIDEDTLFEDIKNHSVLNMYLSFKNRNSEMLSMRQCIFRHYNIKENSVYDNGSINSTYTNFSKMFKKLYSEFPTQIESDFAYCFNESILIKPYNNGEGRQVITNLDPSIFYEVIQNWKDCPYSNRHINGMTFKKLCKFYEYFEKYISKSNDNIDNIIMVYTIERLFNISFIYHLSTYIKNLNGEIDQQLQADILLSLSEIVSIPMVFNRNKYINSIFAKKDYGHIINWQVELKCQLYYLNSYIIPLLERVYYYLIFQYAQNNCQNNNKKSYDFIEKHLKQYVEDNNEKYNYREAMIDNKYEFKNLIGDEPFQINVTEIIYNYKYERGAIEKGKDIIATMQHLKEDITMSQLFENKYNWNTYESNFPYNLIYSIYNSNKENRK